MNRCSALPFLFFLLTEANGQLRKSVARRTEDEPSAVAVAGGNLGDDTETTEQEDIPFISIKTAMFILAGAVAFLVGAALYLLATAIRVRKESVHRQVAGSKGNKDQASGSSETPTTRDHPTSSHDDDEDDDEELDFKRVFPSALLGKQNMRKPPAMLELDLDDQSDVSSVQTSFTSAHRKLQQELEVEPVVKLTPLSAAEC